MIAIKEFQLIKKGQHKKYFAAKYSLTTFVYHFSRLMLYTYNSPNDYLPLDKQCKKAYVQIYFSDL